jgi:conjugal transfer/entry exclusion protein
MTPAERRKLKKKIGKWLVDNTGKKPVVTLEQAFDLLVELEMVQADADFYADRLGKVEAIYERLGEVIYDK